MAATTLLTKAIQAMGMSPADFAREYLGLKYNTFQHRIRVGGLSLEDYHRILFHTGKTFEELFPNPYTPPVHRISQSIAIPRVPGSRIPGLPITPQEKLQQPLQEFKEVPSTVTPASIEQKKEEVAPAPSPARGFKVVDVFNGLPPVEAEQELTAAGDPLPKNPVKLLLPPDQLL